MIKRLAPVVVAFGILFGVAYLTHSSPLVDNKPKNNGNDTIEENERSVEFAGVVNENDGKTDQMVLITSAGGAEKVDVSRIDNASSYNKGDLLFVDGIQDSATRIILAQALSQPENGAFYPVSPENGSTVTSPLVVSGFTKANIDRLYWGVFDSGDRLVSGIVPLSTETSNSSDYQPVRFEVFLPALNNKDFILRIGYDESLKTTESLNLRLLNNQTSTFNVYFPNYTYGSECRDMNAKKRTVAKTSAQGKAALLELLAGPNNLEYSEGVRTVVPQDLRLQKLVINNGKADARFVGAIPASYGECQKMRMISQITETLRQFSSISEVEIYINNELFTA